MTEAASRGDVPKKSKWSVSYVCSVIMRCLLARIESKTTAEGPMAHQKTRHVRPHILPLRFRRMGRSRRWQPPSPAPNHGLSNFFGKVDAHSGFTVAFRNMQWSASKADVVARSNVGYRGRLRFKRVKPTFPGKSFFHPAKTHLTLDGIKKHALSGSPPLGSAHSRGKT